MDIEIIKQDGETFTLSEIGLYVTDSVISSIQMDEYSETIEGRTGLIDHGAEYRSRTIKVKFVARPLDGHDFSHLRDEIYGHLTDTRPFYIREKAKVNIDGYNFVDLHEKAKDFNDTSEYVNGKQYLVRMTNTIELENGYDNFKGELEFRTVGLPFAESVYTTLELHDSGYSATAEKYGLVDNIDDEKVKYRFEPENIWNPNIIPFDEALWEDGSRWSSGLPTASSNGIRLSDRSPITVEPGKEYTFHDESLSNSNVLLWRIFEINSDGTMTQIRYVDRGAGAITVVPSTNRIIISADHSGTSNISKNYLNDGKIKIKLEKGSDYTGFSPKTERFNVYNAGNVTVEPESMLLHIFVASTTGDSITIKNNTTGETFTLNRKMNARHIQVNGMVVTDGTTQVFRDTNKRFISLAPGDNDITVTGATFNEIRFNFKFYYK